MNIQYFPKLLCFMIIFLLSIHVSTVYGQGESKLAAKQRLIRPLIALNALDAAGLDGAIWFLESVKLFSDSFAVGDIYLFHRLEDVIPKNIVDISTLSKIYYVPYSNTVSLPDRRIGRPTKDVEYVTKIIASWEYMMSVVDDETDNSRGMVISLSFLTGSIPVATSAFGKLIDIIAHNRGTDLFLLEKVKKLTSISDWHDLSIISFLRTSENFHNWMRIFHDTYYYYGANRVTFSMLEPRPAILEALAQQEKITVEYFTSKDDVCSATIPYESFFTHDTKAAINNHMIAIKTGNFTHHIEASVIHDNAHRKQFHGHHQHHHYESSRCRHLYFHHFRNSSNEALIPAIEVYCGTSSTKYPSPDTDSCLVLELPTNWKDVDRRIPLSYSHIASRDPTREHELLNNPTGLMGHGILRLRNATDNHTPRPFCWDNSLSTHEELSASRIEYNASYSVPYTHPYHKSYTSSRSKIRAVMMVGTSGSAKALDYLKYMTISKAYYALRHSYDFTVITSNEYISYYPVDLYQDVKSPTIEANYFRGIMTKPLMMLDVMYTHLHSEWLVWTDDDVYINPGWLYLPLDVFLGDVPPHKVMVMSNYRSAFTNILFIRNNAQGRRLMMDWIAIAMSGYIQCHGFDQAALAALIAQRISGDSEFMARPLNFTCLYKADSNLGCNGKHDWSCDFKFESALHYAGFKTKYTTAGFYGGKISSFSKGCANDVILDFHVLTETQHRPRIQCGLCTRTTEVESSGHYDGPLGGGNMPLLRGNINGWFFNHKTHFLFYESYLKTYACTYMDRVVPPCEHHSRQSHLSKQEHDQAMERMGRSTVALADGYAFDLDTSKYCKITNMNVIEHHRENSYMKSYPAFIEKMNQISDDQWTEMYKMGGQTDGRSACDMQRKPGQCPYGPYEDGQRRRRPASTTDSGIDNKFFERENFCETCRVVATSPFEKVKSSVDCRLPSEEEIDKKEGHN